MPKPNLRTIADYKKFSELFLKLSPPDQHLMARDMARQDLFFLLTVVLKRADAVHPWVLERCKEVEANPDGHLDLWSRAHYKDLWVGTPVLTTKGWKKHGELEVGDQVYDKNGFPTTIVATKQFKDSQMYRLTFCNNVEIVAGAGHLWEVEVPSKKRVPGTYKIRVSCGKRIGRETQILSTEELFEMIDRLPYRIGIKLCQPLQNPDIELPIEPYVLGAWIGDGYSEHAAICGIDKEIFEEIESRGYKVQPPRKKDPTRHPDYVVRTITHLHAQLGKAGLRYNKHIPPIYFQGSEAQRRSLLQGLMDTDGNISSTRNCTATFTCKSKALADDVQTLVNSLGYKARVTPIRSSDAWNVCFQVFKTDLHAPCLLPRKVKLLKNKKQSYQSKAWLLTSITPIEKSIKDYRRPSLSGRVFYASNCIQVDSPTGTYLAGRQLIPTHNSTILTFAKTIQDILASHGDNPLPKWEGKEITVGVFSCTRPIAKAFLSQIKREFESNDGLRGLFKDIIWENPGKEAPKWSEDAGIILKRKSNPKESTVEAWGLVDGQPTSKHFDLLVYDDVVTIDSVRSMGMIEKTTEAWALSLNLGTEKAIHRYIGTRYHYADSYKVILDRKAAIPRIHTATIDGTLEGEPVLLSREILAEKRRSMGSYVYASQMFQRPTPDESQTFKMDWLDYHECTSWNNLNIYILVDPANEKQKNSDFTVMTVVGLGADNNYYILDWVRDRLSLTERADVLFMLHRKYKPLDIGYEKYGMQADISHIQDLQRRVNYKFKITELGGILSKTDRIRKLVPLFEAGRILLPQSLHRTNIEGVTHDMTQIFIGQEYAQFPFSEHDDMLDSLARITDDKFEVKWPKLRETRDRYAPKAAHKSSGSAWSV